MPKLPTGRMIKRHYYLRKASTLTLPSFDMPTSPAETLGAALSDNLSLTVTGGLRRRSNDSGDRAWEIGIIVVFCKRSPSSFFLVAVALTSYLLSGSYQCGTVCSVAG